LALSANCRDAVIFRNHAGCLQDQRGKYVRFGLSPGSPDLVGWKRIRVTEDMVGQDLAVFTGIEIKVPGEKPREDQQRWLDTLAAAGGIAGVAHSIGEAVDILS
jgi:hypothetical protein